MYVKDDTLTARYRDAAESAGMSARHARLIQVDRLDAGHAAGRRETPSYRVTTGTEVVRRGRTMRRVLLLWYVVDDALIADEMNDRETLSSVLQASVTHMTEKDRATFDRTAVVVEMTTTGIGRRKAA